MTAQMPERPDPHDAHPVARALAAVPLLAYVSLGVVAFVAITVGVGPGLLLAVTLMLVAAGRSGRGL